jgi:hypothetical protein
MQERELVLGQGTLAIVILQFIVISQPSNSNMEKFSEYAKHYDVRRDAEGNLAFGAGKSGLTPLRPSNPAISLSPARMDLQERLIDFQKKLSFGFTTRQLFDLDAITSREVKSLSINTPIHPMFAKNRWLKENRPDSISKDLYRLPEHLIVDGQATVWTAPDPRVWTLLEPSLRLVSLVIENLPNHPWVNALPLSHEMKC